jgi:hypothetical protein
MNSVRRKMSETTKNENNNTAQPRDKLLGQVITRALSGRRRSSCPTLEEIAALVEGTVSGDERDLLLGHLAECGKCLQIFEMTHDLSSIEEAGKKKRWYVVPSALAAAAVVVVAITLVIKQSPSERLQVAKKEEPLSPSPAKLEKSVSRMEKKESMSVASKDKTLPSTERSARMTSTGKDQQRLTASNEPLLLLSDAEAALPGAKRFGFAASLRNEGPAITVEDMEIPSGREPFPMVVKFIPKDGHPVKIATLKLECLKTKPLDLTSRVMPYAGKDGIRIDRVSLPEGNYRFRISIGDYNGRFSEKDFTIRVSGNF